MGAGKCLVCREELALLGVESIAQPDLQQHEPLGGGPWMCWSEVEPCGKALYREGL